MILFFDGVLLKNPLSNY